MHRYRSFFICFALLAFYVRAQGSDDGEDLFLIRITIDANLKINGSISPRKFTEWAENQKIFKLVSKGNATTFNDFANRTISRLQPSVKAALQSINGLPLDANLNSPGAPKTFAVPPGAPPVVSTAEAKKTGATMTTFRQLALDNAEVWSTATGLSGEVLRKLWNQQLTLVIGDTPTQPVAPARVVQIELNRAQLKNLEKTFPNLKISQFNGPLSVDFASVPSIKPKNLDDDSKSALAAMLKGRKPSSAKPLLIIIDDSWPSAEAFQTTVRIVNNALAKIWAPSSRPFVTKGFTAPLLSDLLGVDPGPQTGSDAWIYPIAIRILLVFLKRFSHTKSYRNQF